MNTVYKKGRFVHNGDRSLLVEYGDSIDIAVNQQVRKITALLKNHPIEGVNAVIPAYRSLAIEYDPVKLSITQLCEHVSRLEKISSQTELPPPRLIEIPVCYGGEFGPDIAFVAEYHGITIEEVVTLHSSVVYHIFAIGFIPGFCFLGGLNKRLWVPRLEVPRTSVPAGSVGIAEAQTGVYPLESPAGWRLIGRTPLRLFVPTREPPFLYQAGDTIKFVPISPEEYSHIQHTQEIR